MNGFGSKKTTADSLELEKQKEMTMESYEDWLDADDDYDADNDPHPERNEADAGLMGEILGIGERHVRRLTRQGVLRQLPSGRYSRLESIDRFVAHKTLTVASDGLRKRKADLLGLHLERELAGLIGRVELTEIAQDITSGFLNGIIEVGERAGEGWDEPERARRREIARQAAAQLEARMTPEIDELLTGKRVQP
ncbi:hypothetical protein [Devosia sp.]|uniref:hypothetical protein n=1 Tax=Devosia sp. TaxID=1871048 RepID=UPI00261CA257|nr:hypothetical protein [Devosia sp.]